MNYDWPLDSRSSWQRQAGVYTNHTMGKYPSKTRTWSTVGALKREPSLVLWGIHLFIQQTFTQRLLYPTHSFHLSTVPNRNLGRQRWTRQAGTRIHRACISWRSQTRNTAQACPLQGSLTCCFFCPEDFYSNHCMTGSFSSSLRSQLWSHLVKRLLFWPLHPEGAPCHQLPTFVSLSIYFITPLSSSEHFYPPLEYKVRRAGTRWQHRDGEWQTGFGLRDTMVTVDNFSIHSKDDYSKPTMGIPVRLLVTSLGMDRVPNLVYETWEAHFFPTKAPPLNIATTECDPGNCCSHLLSAWRGGFTKDSKLERTKESRSLRTLQTPLSTNPDACPTSGLSVM